MGDTSPDFSGLNKSVFTGVCPDNNARLGGEEICEDIPEYLGT
jgi:hypothetical protein